MRSYSLELFHQRLIDFAVVVSQFRRGTARITMEKNSVRTVTMTKSSNTNEKRILNRSVKISPEIYERLLQLQGFLQLKERRKRSMDELLEFILSLMPDLEIDADQRHYVLQHSRLRQEK